MPQLFSFLIGDFGCQCKTSIVPWVMCCVPALLLAVKLFVNEVGTSFIQRSSLEVKASPYIEDQRPSCRLNRRSAHVLGIEY
jgi:hypothetical protein